MTHKLNCPDSGICINMEHTEVDSSPGRTSPQNLPPLLRHISSEASHVFDNYDSDIENLPQITSKPRSEAPSQLDSLAGTSVREAATPSKIKNPHPSYSSKSSISPGSPLPPHVISISMPSSPAKFQIKQAKKVSLQAQTEGSRLQNSSNGSFSFAKIKPRKQGKFYSQSMPSGKTYAEAR